MTKAQNNKHLDPKSVQFSVFNSDEIKKLSVAKITIPISFNSLGHPLRGGLYDPALGPVNEQSDPCATCGSNVFNCLGHMGHIELQLVVFNSLFYRTIYNILRVSCLSCYKLRIPEDIRYLLIAQLTLLERGYVAEAQALENTINNVMSTNSSSHEAHAVLVKEEIDNYVTLVLSGQLSEGRPEHTKSIDSLKNLYLKAAFAKVNKKKCNYCLEKVHRISFLQNKLMTTKDVLESANNVKSSKSKVATANLMPDEVRSNMRNIWKEGCDLIVALVPVLKNSNIQYPTDIFFFDIIPVPPPRTRPVNFVAGKLVEHGLSSIYKLIIEDCAVARNIIKTIQEKGTNSLSEQGKLVVESAQGNTVLEKLHHVWQQLQAHVDLLVDGELNPSKPQSRCGLKQMIEKKDGLIRMHMMGKRVNFAARSVITPDPNLNIDEIGIPETFAKTLTYPVPVTPWNVTTLRKLVLNGPKVHPGAVTVQNEDGTISKISAENQVQRESIAKRLLTPEGRSLGFLKRTKIVHRHLQNGDVLLLNRQPTLHRPSIMAHKARILKGEKTLRLNYANCKAYNADFDGDEMNAHFPQNEVARSEAYNLVNVSNQYLVPKDGTPLSGLIQDHMVSGVRLSVRGRFFSKEDYFGLVFHALPHLNGNVKLLKPAIIKPIPLWSGKQVLSTVIINIIPKGKHRITLNATSKISSRAWQCATPRAWMAGGTPFLNLLEMSEAEVVIRQGELLCGVLDKTHYGATPYGLIHCVYELYGGICSISLLSGFAKLFTAFLQIEGFTLGVEDILVVKKADKKRKNVIKTARQVGYEATATAFDLTFPSEEELETKLAEVYGDTNSKGRAIIDRSYKKYLDTCTNDVNKTCLPAGLLQKFPANNLQLMVQSGAKGSTVNTMQISCLLGQIELEGKRPPLMLSGKSLPCFRRFDLTPRAGGFVDGRFMTGIQPQEFFFHCMAGREGLIDTAVKTSRSGYLQRCLVKHLEGLVVHYDSTVRDSDGSVIQFCYGEDGMDVMKVQFLKEHQMPFLAENYQAVVDRKALKTLKHIEDEEAQCKLENQKKQVKKWKKKKIFSHKTRTTGKKKKCPDPVTSIFQADRDFGALTEKLEMLMNGYLATRNAATPLVSEFQDMMYLKSIKSQCSAGEPVGILAAQSIGEPSTQMTLNTFHFAGRGEMNVTLGIPRLREILMIASKNIKTPSMDIPFLPSVSSLEKKAENLKIRLRRVLLSDILEYAIIEDSLNVEPSGNTERTYYIKLQFLPHKVYKSQFIVKPNNILKYVENHFISKVLLAIKRSAKFKDEILSLESGPENHAKTSSEENEDDPMGKDQIETEHLADIVRRGGVGEGHESSDEEPEAEDEDATAARSRSRHQENQEYEEDDNVLIDDYNELELDTFSNEGIESEQHEIEDDQPKEISNTEQQEINDQRQKKVIISHNYVKDYKYDTEKELWCEVIIGLPLTFKRLDLSTLLKVEAEKAVVWEVPSLKKAFTYVSPDTQSLMLKTDGVNFVEMFHYNELLDLNRLYSNDIYEISLTYGIEAARTVIVKEVKDVFKMYGITVDPRHLLLVADYMTFEGTFEPLSRRGMEDSSSPLQQISFESSLNFLKTATLQGKRDYLRSPSSRIMLGRPCINGTGIFSVLQKLVISDDDLSL